MNSQKTVASNGSTDRPDSVIEVDHAFPVVDPQNIYPLEFKYPLSHIILDLSGVSFVDTVGCKLIKNVSHSSLTGMET
ncbi:hypothetical protein DPMN_151916 [Dreissena polymorpha]|uniref:STAS domain-containing protein n=1 Tax=Dreissena polymorpha TaxID=45954 RepID=A0A9D4J7F7_DREPO|nr:hypothetical protein DPMN_151916 [Dreissena polymorpha]